MRGCDTLASFWDNKAEEQFCERKNITLQHVLFHYSFVPYRPLYWQPFCPNGHHPYLVKEMSIIIKFQTQRSVFALADCKRSFFCNISAIFISNHNNSYVLLVLRGCGHRTDIGSITMNVILRVSHKNCEEWKQTVYYANQYAVYHKLLHMEQRSHQSNRAQPCTLPKLTSMDM